MEVAVTIHAAIIAVISILPWCLQKKRQLSNYLEAFVTSAYGEEKINLFAVGIHRDGSALEGNKPGGEL